MSTKRINVSLDADLIRAIESHPDFIPQKSGLRSGIGGFLHQAATEKLELAPEDYHEARAKYWARARYWAEKRTKQTCPQCKKEVDELTENAICWECF